MSKSPIGEPLQRDLENALKTDEFKMVFEELKKRDAVFERYPTVDALVALCVPDAPDPDGRERALGWILRALRQGNGIYPLLHMMFWSVLVRLHGKFSRHTNDPESLFERIHWEFYQAAMRYDPDRLPGRIATNLFLNTKRGVYNGEAVEIRERRKAKQVKELAEAGVSWTSLSESDTPPEELETFLLDLAQRGILKQVQYEILLETDVRRSSSLAEWARRKGMLHRTAQSHRRRAFLALRRHLGLEGPEE